MMSSGVIAAGLIASGAYPFGLRYAALTVFVLLLWLVLWRRRR
jgi:hypothetical protein